MVLPDHKKQAVTFSFSEIRQVEPNLSRTVKILIGVGVGAAVFAVVALALGARDNTD